MAELFSYRGLHLVISFLSSYYRVGQLHGRAVGKSTGALHKGQLRRKCVLMKDVL